MIITTKKHKAIVAELLKTEPAEVAQLKAELQQARDLKEILEKMALASNTHGTLLSSGCFNTITGGLNFPDNIPQYVDDFYGGKVIRQEATKVIHISRDGDVTTGMTKRQPDEHFTYILDRQEP